MLVRATGSLRLLEQALEEQGLPTYVVGGRGYWSQEQVRDGIAYLSVLANPLDEPALLAVLASPFCGVGTDALVLLTEAGRASGRGPAAALREVETATWPAALPEAERARLAAFARVFAAERPRAERAPAEELLERAIVATGYDLAVLARSGGERRLANLRKLMRLAREYEAAEGPDLRGFIAFAATQDLIEAREGEAALESEGLDAVRLMTIHRAKGLEFPVVCVADLGRAAGGARDRLLLGRDGGVGLRLAPIGGGELVSGARLGPPGGDRAGRGGRGGAAPVLRRHDARVRAAHPVRRTRPRAPARAAPGRPADRLDRRARSTGGDPLAALEHGRAGLLCRLNAPATVGEVLPALSPRRPRPGWGPEHGAARPARRARRAARAPAPDAPAALLQLARRLRPLRLPLLPRARAAAAARDPAAAR